MAEKTGITWTEATWNPWHGCHKVSAGCKFCYMFREKEFYGKDPNTVVRSKSTFNDPLRWLKDRTVKGELVKGGPKLVFTCSWSDWFIEEADAWRDEAWQIVRDTPHYYLILTKRPERILSHLPADWGDGYKNVGIGVSTEDQAMADVRVPLLLDVPAKMRFLSIEPQIASVSIERFIPYATVHGGVNEDIRKALDELVQVAVKQFGGGIHWLISGGESGNDTGYYQYRPALAGWFAKTIKEGERYGIAVFLKQFGTSIAKLNGFKDRSGADPNEWPEWAQVQQFPEQILKWDRDRKLAEETREWAKKNPDAAVALLSGLEGRYGEA